MIDKSGRGAARYIELKFNSDPANLAATRRAIDAFCGNCGFDEHTGGQIMICVNEALTNVMRHAYQGAVDRPIVVRVEMVEDSVRVSIRDWGSGVNPLEVPQPKRDPLRPGGLGLLCLQQLMDEVAFRRQEDGMLLVMVRRKSAGSREASTGRAAG